MRVRTVTRRAIGSIALAMFVPVFGGAQSAPSSESRLPSGTKIRFEMRDGVRHEGRVVALSRDTLRAIRTGATETAFRVSDIQKLDAMTGRHRKVLRSMLIGTGAGVVVGAVLGAATHEPCESTEPLGCLLAPETRAQSAGLVALGGGILGFLVGGVAGMIPRDRWERVRLDGNVVHLRTRTLPDGAQGLGVAVAF